MCLVTDFFSHSIISGGSKLLPISIGDFYYFRVGFVVGMYHCFFKCSLPEEYLNCFHFYLSQIQNYEQLLCRPKFSFLWNTFYCSGMHAKRFRLPGQMENTYLVYGELLSCFPEWLYHSRRYSDLISSLPHQHLV